VDFPDERDVSCAKAVGWESEVSDTVLCEREELIREQILC
jgi:hypothetical protein